MEAKDTVIKNLQPFWVDAEFHDVDGKIVCDEKYNLEKLLLEQAEISFRAGYQEAISRLYIWIREEQRKLGTQ